MAEQTLPPAVADMATPVVEAPSDSASGETQNQTSPARLRRSRPTRFPCVICGRDRPARDVTQLDVVRPSLFDRIKADYPDLPAEGYICGEDLDRFRSRYVSELLGQERGELTKLEQEVVQSLADHETSCRKHRSRVRRPSYLRRTPFGSFGIVRRQLDLHHNFFRHIARLDGVQRRYYGAGAFRPLSVHSSESRVVMSGGCSSANHHDEFKSARKQRIVCDPRTIIGSTSKPSWKSGTCMKRSTIS